MMAENLLGWKAARRRQLSVSRIRVEGERRQARNGQHEVYPAGARVTGFLPFPLFYEFDGGEKSSKWQPGELDAAMRPGRYTRLSPRLFPLQPGRVISYSLGA